MNKILVLSVIFIMACAKQPVHPPVGGILSEKDLQQSKVRAKNLNQIERIQIEDWIKNQDQKFYSMSLNYWVNVPDLSNNPKKEDGVKISYEYDIYDFDQVKLYDLPVKKTNVYFGKFEELKAVEDALRYMEPNSEATLLVPSVLGFGTYGDNQKIPNDMPLIIKLRTL